VRDTIARLKGRWSHAHSTKGANSPVVAKKEPVSVSSFTPTRNCAKRPIEAYLFVKKSRVSFANQQSESICVGIYVHKILRSGAYSQLGTKTPRCVHVPKWSNNPSGIMTCSYRLDRMKLNPRRGSNYNPNLAVPGNSSNNIACAKCAFKMHNAHTCEEMRKNQCKRKEFQNTAVPSKANRE